MIFETKKEAKLSYKAWSELYHLLFFNIGLVIGNITFYSEYYLVIETSVFFLLLIKLFSKRSRQIYKLIFNDEGKILKIFYYQFFVLKYTKGIIYDELNYSYKQKLYRRAILPKTLEFRKGEKLVAEIKQKYNLGWSNMEIDNIYSKLKKIKEE